MTLGWDAVSALGAYRITEIPRQADEDPRREHDPGRTQRIAALVAAFHSGGSPVAFGWIRHCAGGPIQLVAAGDAIVGSETEQQALLTLPAGAQAQPLTPGTMARLLTQLPSWRSIAGLTDGLLTNRGEPGGRFPPAEQGTGERPSLED